MKNMAFFLLIFLCACGSKITYENRVQRHRAVASGNAFKTKQTTPINHENYQPQKPCIKSEDSNHCFTQD